MSQTVQLVDTLKKLLRERKITYAEVAEKLNLSEANVKRMFSKRHFTLNRLEEICDMAGADLGYLMARMHEGTMVLDELMKRTNGNWYPTPSCCWWRSYWSTAGNMKTLSRPM